jgi:hypothetical protein
MGTIYLTHINDAGKTLKATIERLADGYFREDDTETFVSAPAFADKDITLTEGSSENVGSYTATVTGTTWNDGLYRLRVHDASLSNRTISTSVFAVKGGYEVAIGEESTAHDLYTADIQFIADSANATPVDEYIVIWFKNGVPLTTEVTGSTIQVVKRTDGTNLIASTAMTEVVSGTWKYNATTTARQTAGEAYKVICVGTISGNTITRAKGFGRDSSV